MTNPMANLMTNQEFFDNAYRYHVLDGNPLGARKHERSGNIHCSYALGCAIGCQIPDKELAALLDDEGFGPKEVLAKARTDDRTFEALRPFLGVDVALIKWMQNAHDLAALLASRPEGRRTKALFSYGARFMFTDSVKGNYELVAAYYGLAVPE